MSVFSVSKVEVVAGAESVQLPFKCPPNLPEDATVEWKRFGLKPTTVHVSQSGREQPDKQNTMYQNRTEMSEDLSLILNNPKDQDGGFYTCTISRNRRVLQKQWVRLQVKGQDCGNRSRVMVHCVVAALML